MDKEFVQKKKKKSELPFSRKIADFLKNWQIGNKDLKII